MNDLEIKLNPLHTAFVDRFLKACQADKRILAACLIGSYALGKADAYSDIDLMVITTDSAFEEFYSQRASFLRLLGELLFLEDFGIPDIAFYIYADGSEGELSFGSQGRLSQLYDAPFHTLLDKKKLLAGVNYTAPAKSVDVRKQTEKLQKYINLFWHEMSHFITAMGRGQIWWAHGQLESLRSICVNLARLHNDFSDTEAGEEPYFKIENCLPVEKLAALKNTFRPLEKNGMLQSVQTVLAFYVEVAQSLAETHQLSYPEGLESIMRVRLKKLQDDLA